MPLTVVPTHGEVFVIGWKGTSAYTLDGVFTIGTVEVSFHSSLVTLTSISASRVWVEV